MTATAGVIGEIAQHQISTPVATRTAKGTTRASRGFSNAEQIRDRDDKQRPGEQHDAGDAQPLPPVQKTEDGDGFRPADVVAAAQRIQRTLLMRQEGVTPAAWPIGAISDTSGGYRNQGPLVSRLPAASRKAATPKNAAMASAARSQPGRMIRPDTWVRRNAAADRDECRAASAPARRSRHGEHLESTFARKPGMPSDWNEPPATLNSLPMKFATKPCRAIAYAAGSATNSISGHRTRRPRTHFGARLLGFTTGDEDFAGVGVAGDIAAQGRRPAIVGPAVRSRIVGFDETVIIAHGDECEEPPYTHKRCRRQPKRENGCGRCDIGARDRHVLVEDRIPPRCRQRSGARRPKGLGGRLARNNVVGDADQINLAAEHHGLRRAAGVGIVPVLSSYRCQGRTSWHSGSAATPWCPVVRRSRRRYRFCR